MQYVEKFAIVDAPAAASYSLWRAVEEWPRFLKAIREVRRINDRCFKVLSQRDDASFESTVEVTLLIPQRRMAWRTISGDQNSGVIIFDDEEGGKSRVTFQMQYEAGAEWQNPKAMSDRLEFHLACFKEYIEAMTLTSKIDQA